MIVALTSAKGSPGVSTWAAALVAVWPEVTGRDVLLVDADVSGAGPTGDHLRHGLGDGRCLLRWAAAAGRAAVRDELVSLDRAGRRLLLPGLPDAAGAPVVAPHWELLLGALRDLEAPADDASAPATVDVLVDIGRWGSRYEATPLLSGADAVAVVLRSDFASVSLTQGLCAVLPRPPDAALLVGERDPYSAREVARALGTDVAGALPVDPRGARRVVVDLTGSGPARSAVIRAARAAATRLRALISERSGV